MQNDLLANLNSLHTTELGEIRIQKNLAFTIDNVIQWCREKILSPNAVFTKKGKNWYVEIDDFIITANAHSYTIITAHRQKKMLKN